MVRLAISVEGLTEERFVKELLAPHLQTRNIVTTPIILGKTGGDVYLPRVKKELNQIAASFDKVTTLYDFYGFRGKEQGETRASLERKILDNVANRLQGRIIPYVQMYEFEGLLFSSPEAIESHVPGKGLADWAQKVLDQFHGNPEQINDSKTSAPSKRLQERAQSVKTRYIKTVHGPAIAQDIGLGALREKCAGFNGWLNQLEGLQG